MAISRRELLVGIGGAGAAAAVASMARLGGRPPTTSRNAQRSVSPTIPIRLDRNENAFGPSPRVIAALNEDPGLVNRYPQVEIDSLTDQLAHFHHTGREQIVLGSGSSAILRACVALFLGAGKSLVMAEPSFEPIAQYARAAGAEVLPVPLTPRYCHDVAAMRARITAATRLVYICNPNNPTGTVTARKEIEELVNGLPPRVWAIIDEAYHPYIDAPSRETSFIENPASNPNVIVTRTFSNLYGLAGLRMGYAFTSPSTARRIQAWGVDAELGVSALRVAKIALADQEYARRMIGGNANARQEFVNQAIARELKPVDSAANFVLLYIDGCLEVAEHFQRHDILIAGDFPSLAQSIRVTMGRPEEMAEFWRVLDLKPSLRPI